MNQQELIKAALGSEQVKLALKLANYRRNPERYFTEQLKIRTKDGTLEPFIMWPCQRPVMEKIVQQYRRTGMIRMIVLKARQVGLCLQPLTRVLTADLRWVAIQDLQPGELIVAIDEEAPDGHERRMRTGTVEAVRRVFEPAFRLTFDDGREIMATGGHRFLSKGYGGLPAWRPVERMRAGNVIRKVANVWGPSTFDDGWFGGIIDGEGHFRAKSSGGAELTVTQNPGAVLDAATDYLRSNGYTFRECEDIRSYPGVIRGGPCRRLYLARMSELFRIIGQTRPKRFIENKWWEGKSLPGKRIGNAWAKIVSIEPLPAQPMIDLQTSTRTFIAEGLVSHNSVFSEGLISWSVMLNPNTNGLIVAHDAATAETLFGISKTFYDYLDPQIKPMRRYSTKREFTFENPDDETRPANPGLGSRLVITSANNIHSGIGRTLRSVHISEAARFGNPEGIIDGIFPALARKEGTMCIIESTARYSGYWFKDMCDRSQAGEGDYEFIFVPWYLQPDYRTPLLPGEKLKLSLEEKRMMQEYGITQEHIKFFRSALATIGNAELLKQSYPFTPEDAWISPGDQAFPSSKLDEQRRQAANTGIYGIGDIETSPDGRVRFMEFPKGKLTVWDPPEKGKAYDIGVDVALGTAETEGEGDGDWSIMCVLERGTNKQVAEWASRSTDVMKLAEEAAALGYWYNTAQIAVEVNGIGVATNMHLSKIGYPNLYLWRFRDEATPRLTRKIGWETSMRSKRMLISFALHQLVNDRVIIRSKELLEEMRNFVDLGNGNYGGSAGSHDDHVMAWMIALIVSDDENFERWMTNGTTRVTKAVQDDPRVIMHERQPYNTDPLLIGSTTRMREHDAWR